jgi:hypothetical protein
MLYGWTDDYVLSMPARRFFAMRDAGYRQYNIKTNKFFYEMCDVVAISGCTAEYQKAIKGIYWQKFVKAMDEDPAEVHKELQQRKSLDLSNKKHKDFAFKWLDSAQDEMRKFLPKRPEGSH